MNFLCPFSGTVKIHVRVVNYAIPDVFERFFEAYINVAAMCAQGVIPTLQARTVVFLNGFFFLVQLQSPSTDMNISAYL